MTFTEQSIIGVIFRFKGDTTSRTLEVTKYHLNGYKDLLERNNGNETRTWTKDGGWKGLEITNRIELVSAPTVSESSIQLYPLIE